MPYEASLLFAITCVNALLSLFVILGSKKSINKVYSLFTLFASLWSLGIAYFFISPIQNSIFIANSYYASAALIGASFLLFASYFPSREVKTSKILLYVFLPLSIFVVLFYLNHNLIIKDVFYSSSLYKDVIINKINYLIYGVYFVFVVILAYYRLFTSLKKAETKDERAQLKLVIYGTAIGFIFGMMFDLFLPFLGNYRDIWVGPLFSSFMVISIGYAISKHHMFNIKIITTEILTFIIWIFVITRIVISSNITEKLMNLGLLVVLIISGILLIRSILNEVEQREKIETLAKQLQDANEKLKGLDKLKTEFLSLASHQLRSPLTAIKGYASMLSEGAFGKLDAKKSEAVNRIYTSAQGLVNIVEDLLNISKIEQGGMKYEFMPTSLSSVVDTLFNEMKVPAESKHLEFSLDMDKHDKFIVSADPVKLKQVFLNLVDNSIKYTQKGFVKISLKRVEDKIVFSVTDNGMGISPETKSKLFEKFSRGEGGKTNTGGSGLGLYLAQQIAKAHKGDIVIESEGLGKGSTFIVSIPASGSYPN
jgi:signal transduction histidine kinase